MVKITKRFCTELHFPEDKNPRSSYAVYDCETKGFGIRVTASGVKTFVLKYRLGKRQREMSLGRFGVLTVATARKKAIEHLARINEGIDPQQQNDLVKAGCTFLDLCTDYMERVSKPRKRSWSEDERRIRNHLRPLHKRPVSSITRFEITHLHDSLGKSSGQYEANRVLSLVSTIFQYAIAKGYTEEDKVNPATGIKKFPEDKRISWLQGEQLSRFLESVELEDNIYMRTIFTFLLLSGRRKSEALNLKWEDVDIPNKRIFVPLTKNGKPYRFPISNDVVELLKGLPEDHRNPYVFCGRNEGQPLKELKGAFSRIVKRAGIEGFRIHDLRHTAASIAISNGVRLEVVQRMLGHASISATEIYAHMADSAVQEGADTVSKIVDIAQYRKRMEKTA